MEGLEGNMVDPKEMKRQERLKRKAEKQMEKEHDRALKKAAAESRKETRPGERVKQLTVQLGHRLISDAELMSQLVTKLSELGVEYEVLTASSMPGSADTDSVVLWMRSVNERTVDGNAKIIQSSVTKPEPYALVMMSGHRFLDLLRSNIYQGSLGSAGTVTESPLLEEIQKLLSDYQDKKLTVAIVNLDGALRDQKTRKNRKLRAAVREGGNVEQSDSHEVSRVECEHALVGIQLKYGNSCCMRMCQKPVNVSELIVTMTKSVAEIPFKKENPFTFCADILPCTSKKALQESSNKVTLIWQSQLMQIPGVSHPVASAIAREYPSPAHLMEDYSKSSSSEIAQQLLQNIQIRRGTGVTSTTRRVGPTLSLKIHTILTMKDKDMLLS